GAGSYREVADHRDAEIIEVVLGPDTAAHQNRRAVHGAGAEDDLTAGCHGDHGAVDEFDTDSGLALEDHARDVAVAADREVLAVASGIEVGVVGRDAHEACGVAAGVAADASGARAVVVVVPGEARRCGGLFQSDVDVSPGLAGSAVHRHGAVAA